MKSVQMTLSIQLHTTPEGVWPLLLNTLMSFNLSVEISQLQENRYKAILSLGSVKHITAIDSRKYLKYKEGNNCGKEERHQNRKRFI